MEFSRLCEIMETKLAKILENMKTFWTFMLSLARCVMSKYMTLLMTMAIDGLDNDKAKANFNLFCDV
jgi:hypothetical protein